MPLRLTETQSNVRRLLQDLKDSSSKGASNETIQASDQQTRGTFVIYKPDNLHSTAGAGNKFPKMLVKSVDIVPGKLLLWRNSFSRMRCCQEHTTLR
jgi:hypothetical protein